MPRTRRGAAHSQRLLRELYPTLGEIIDWHRRGTRYSIHMDPDDGLLYSGENEAHPQARFDLLGQKHGAPASQRLPRELSPGAGS